MKRAFLIIFVFVFSLNLNIANALRIGCLVPSQGIFASFGESFINGLSLALSQNNQITLQDSSKNVEDALENLYLSGSDVIVGPFMADNVNKIERKLCSGGIVAVLPFARSQYECSNIFTYNYDPLKAAKQLADRVCENVYDNNSVTLVLYSYDNLNMRKKDIFLESFKNCKGSVYTEGFQKKKNYNELIKSVFKVEKIKDESIFSTEEVFIHSFYADNVVIFAPQRDFLNIVNLMDYYDISPANIFATDITVDKQFLPISRNMIKKMHLITPYYLCKKSKQNKEFVSRYKSEYQVFPDFMAALGFDLGRLLNDADRISLEAKLRSTMDFDGLIGRLLFFDDEGEGIFNYNILNYREIMKCKKLIMNR